MNARIIATNQQAYVLETSAGGKHVTLLIPYGRQVKSGMRADVAVFRSNKVRITKATSGIKLEEK